MEFADATKLRAYFFGNMYLSPIQQGIQAAHVVTKLFWGYGYEGSPDEKFSSGYTLYEWAGHGVTKILLNGGYQDNLRDIHSIFLALCPEVHLPFEQFREEQASLNGALTSVGVVVPEEVYDYKWEDDIDTQRLIHRRFFPAIPADYSMAQECLAMKLEIKSATETPQGILELVNKMDYSDLKEKEVVLLLHRTLKTCRLA